MSECSVSRLRTRQVWGEVDQFIDPVQWWRWSPEIHSTRSFEVDEQEYFYIPDGMYTVTLGAAGSEVCGTRSRWIWWPTIEPVVPPSVWCGAKVDTNPMIRRPLPASP